MINKKLLIRSLSEIEVSNVSFALRPYFPIGKQTLLVGDPGDGKTWIAVDFCARITRGLGLPFLFPIEGDSDPESACTIISTPGVVLYVSGEDSAADTLKPRFMKQGGDETLFYISDGLVEDGANGQRRSSLRLSNLAPLEEAIQALKPMVVVLDPIQATIGGHVDLHRANEVREALQGVSKLAERYNFALLIVCHLNKAVQSKAIYRVLGSIDLVAQARSVLLAGPYREKGTYAMAHLKCSVDQKGATRLYTIDDTGLHWVGIDEVTADEMLSACDRGSKRADAEALLKDFLSSGPKPSKEIFELGAKKGFTAGRIRSAARSLGVVHKPSEFRGQWLWSLAADGNSLVQPISAEGDLPAQSSDDCRDKKSL